MDKNSLFEHLVKLAKDYKDPRGFISQEKYDVNNDPYIFQNPYLFSGQYLLALKFLTDKIDIDFYYNFTTFHIGNVITPGLFTRFKYPYINTSSFDSVSLDEHNGLVFSQHGFEISVYQYGKNNWWTFYEKEPNQNFIKAIKENPKGILTIFKSIINMIKIAKKTGDWDGSNELDKEIFKNYYLTILSRRRLPKDIFLLKVKYYKHAITLIEKIHFYISIYDTIKKPKRSGVNMLLYKFIYLHEIGYENFIIRKLRTLFLEKVDIASFQNEFYRDNILFKVIAKYSLEKLMLLRK